jgi:hypothetical protein
MKTEDALPYFDNKVLKLAKALGITRGAVYEWRGKVPPRRAYEIAELTGGALKPPSLLSRKLNNKRAG